MLGEKESWGVDGPAKAAAMNPTGAVTFSIAETARRVSVSTVTDPPRHTSPRLLGVSPSSQKDIFFFHWYDMHRYTISDLSIGLLFLVLLLTEQKRLRCLWWNTSTHKKESKSRNRHCGNSFDDWRQEWDPIYLLNTPSMSSILDSWWFVSEPKLPCI